VNEGEEYDLRIIRIDTDKRRLGLSLKQALPPEAAESELDWQIAPSDENEAADSDNAVVADAVADPVVEIVAVETVAEVAAPEELAVAEA